MSIIMVDYEDAYKRADKFAEMSLKCAALAAKAADDKGMSEKLIDLSEKFKSLETDIRTGAEIWDDFYRRNVRL